MSFLFTGCCTLRNTPFQTVQILSDPPGANIVVDGHFVGTTPNRFNLHRNRSHEILIEKEGYYPESHLITSRLSYTQLSSNLFFPIAGMLWGFYHDFGHGYIWALDPLQTIVGFIGGSAVGVVGAGIDICTGKAKVLSKDVIQSNLKPWYLK